MCSKKNKQHSYAPTNSKQKPHIDQPHQQASDISDFFEQMGTMPNLLTSMLITFVAVTPTTVSSLTNRLERCATPSG
jgi:hypothetical protein